MCKAKAGTDPVKAKTQNFKAKLNLAVGEIKGHMFGEYSPYNIKTLSGQGLGKSKGV